VRGEREGIGGEEREVRGGEEREVRGGEEREGRGGEEREGRGGGRFSFGHVEWKMGTVEGNRPKRKKTWTRGH
jgi:hypothetical protein